MDKHIALFPLNLVIFPGSKYPLHIFEEKYKKMVNRCIAHNEGFGIASKIDLELASVGCYVVIDKITKEYEDGRKDIVVKGMERFRINTTSLHRDEYILADVTPYTDTQEAKADVLIFEKALVVLQDILDKAGVTVEDSFWSNLTKSKKKSYKLAEKSGLNIKQQQDLLTLQNEDHRLTFILEHLERVEEFIEKDKAIKNIVAGDGYINN